MFTPIEKVQNRVIIFVPQMLNQPLQEILSILKCYCKDMNNIEITMYLDSLISVFPQICTKNLGYGQNLALLFFGKGKH